MVVVEAMEGEEVILTNITMTIRAINHSEAVAVDNKEVQDVEPIKVPMK